MGPKASGWTGTENLSSTGIRFPGRPARSESLCRLSYPGPLTTSAEVKDERSCRVAFPYILSWYVQLQICLFSLCHCKYYLISLALSTFKNVKLLSLGETSRCDEDA